MLKLGHPEYATQTRIRQAARRARVVYPGPVGELVSRELDAYADMAWLWCNGKSAAWVASVMDDVLARAVPAA